MPNIRDIIADPLLPVMGQIKNSKKEFLTQWVTLLLVVSVSLFVLVFLARLAWFLPLFVL